MNIPRVGLGLSLGAAALVAIRGLSRRPALDLRGKVVLITGGSRGLGLAMAREFGDRGARVAICARDRAELDRAQADLASRDVDVGTFVCDVTDPQAIEAMVQELGPVDVLVNNAGMIQVGPVSAMQPMDFQQAMDVMFWGPLRLTLAVLPGMRDRRAGSIVNITSFGGKVSVPHLLPYCCAKFALVALSDGLRRELRPLGIRVTTILPGLMRTGSHLNAQFKGDQAGEYRWFAAGAASPAISISAERAARSIVRATVEGCNEKVLSVPADLLIRLHGLSPSLISELLSAANRLLPEGDSDQTRLGREVEAEWNSVFWRALTASGMRAAQSLNEAPQSCRV